MPALFFKMKLTDRILAKMDEVNQGEGLAAEEIIPVLNNTLWDSVNKYFEVCPHRYLTKTEHKTQAQKEGNWHVIELPRDFLRLVELMCNGWEQPVLAVFPIEASKYETNKFLRSGVMFPRAFLDSDNRLKFRGDLKELQYQKKLTKEEDINPDALDSLSWYIAGDLYIIFGEGDRAQVCYKKV